MQVAYFDCTSGIAGDMTLAALIDAGADLAAIQTVLDTLQIPGLRLTANPVKRCGFRGLHLAVEHEPEHKHRHLHHIEAMIDRASMSARAKQLSRAIFGKLAIAEAKVHGSTIEKVHFHEVGAIDSMVDILGTAMALDALGIERLYFSTVATGYGTIQIAHGTVGIPAPATAELLQGVPQLTGNVEAELTTPTGAAMIAALAEKSFAKPAMVVNSTGYGAGTKDFPHQANILRVSVGTLSNSTIRDVPTSPITELTTNLDTLTGEELGYAIERLWELDPLDVYITPIQMKKGRPAVMLTVLCESQRSHELEFAMFKHSGTLGIRRRTWDRTVLARHSKTVETPWGPIVGKVSLLDGVSTFSPEFEACRQIAVSCGLTLQTVVQAAERAFQNAT